MPSDHHLVCEALLYLTRERCPSLVRERQRCSAGARIFCGQERAYLHIGTLVFVHSTDQEPAQLTERVALREIEDLMQDRGVDVDT